VEGLPPAAAEAVRGSVFKALGVAAQLNLPALADSARASFVLGMDDALRVAAVIAVVAAVAGALLLPGRSSAPEAELVDTVGRDPASPTVGDEVAVGG
jgi:hypothetical protein